VEEEEVYKHFNSITKKEYQTAREKGIPIFIFVEKGVYAEYQTFKHNRANKTIVYAHVDNVNVFRLLDEIINQRANNFVKDFEHVYYYSQEIRVVDFIRKFNLKTEHADFFCDGVHPSKKTYQIWARDVSNFITHSKEIKNALQQGV
jgi:lysophospholipase L1-like esterase